MCLQGQNLSKMSGDAQLLQLCPSLWDPTDWAGSSVHQFSRQRYWSGLLCPPWGDLPHAGIEPLSLMSPALAGKFSTTLVTWEDLVNWSAAISYIYLFSLLDYDSILLTYDCVLKHWFSSFFLFFLHLFFSFVLFHKNLMDSCNSLFA